MDRALSFVERYHDATRYTPESLRRLGVPDPAAQPSPFKEWHGEGRLALPGGPGSPVRKPRGASWDAARLGRLLFHTYGVTRVQEVPGLTLHFRAAPSAGALYPAELYVATRGIEGVPDGLHDYQAVDHALAPCWEGDFWPDLRRLTFDAPGLLGSRAVLIFTGVYARGRWRYQDRSYRRLLLDTGHAMGNAILAAAAEGCAVRPVADFADDGIDHLLLLDPEAEGPVLLGLLGEAADFPPPRPLSRSPVRAELPSPDLGAWIPAVHDASRMDRPLDPLDVQAPFPGPPTIGPPVRLQGAPLPGGPAVLEAIRRRRSTRAYRSAGVPAEALGRILAHAWPGGSAPDRASIAPDLLHWWLVVSDVEGVPPGVWRYDGTRHVMEPLRRGDPRQALLQACLLQELGGSAAFTVVHTVDLPRAVDRYGERAYRYAHLEAGLVGERLNLAALSLGLGASGIGGFFDDVVIDLLQAPACHAVVYLTTVGVPGGESTP